MKKNQNHENKFFDRSRIIIILLTTVMLTGLAQVTSAQSCSKDNAKTTAAVLEQLMWNKDVAGIKKMTDADPGLINQRLINDETMLTIAAWNGETELIKYLIEKGADPGLQNKWDNAALHNASIKGYADIVAILLGNGADVNQKGSVGNSPLFQAAVNQHPETVALLLKYGAHVNAPNNYQSTPIMASSWRGNPDVMSLLLQHGADYGFITEEGNTILHNLANNGNSACITMLLDKGVDANRGNQEGKLPLHIAIINEHTDAAVILMKATKNLNIQENVLGNTPLHIAAINGNDEIVKLLLDAKADASFKNKAGHTAVGYAIKYGYAGVTASFADRNLASKQDVKTAAGNRDHAVVMTGNEEARVIYCGHSGWTVLTKNHVLVFDYWEPGTSSAKGLAGGTINPGELKDKNVIVFVSHDHSDHYDDVIYGWGSEIKNIQYVYGFKAETSWVHESDGYQGPAYTFIPNNEQRELNGVKVTTFPSTDSGQGFYVEADGITIYHPGDHAWFADIDEAPFKKEVDFVASLGASPDIAFLPVTGCPSRWEKAFIQEGFLYSIDKLNPAKVFPMHALNREYEMKEFAELAAGRKFQNQIICADNAGDQFNHEKSTIAVK